MKRFPGMEETINNPSKAYPHLYFLGTGSTLSMALRNSSSVLLFLKEDTCVLLDCGAGTLNQLMRLFGSAETSNILRNLKAIYVSHHHLDHFLGIPSILSEREKLNEVPKLYIFGVHRVLRFLKLLSPAFLQLDNNVVINNNSVFFHESNIFNPSLHDDVCSYLNMSKIETCYVPHCHDSFGVAFTINGGWKMVYSGDTKPSERLVNIGKGCDLLIHEATLEEGMEENALDRSHSTVSQAIDIGNCMNAKHVILTHFSQRYSSIPYKKNDFPENVGIAFDNMKVASCDLPYLSHMYPIYKEMFIEKWERMKELEMKREIKQKRNGRYQAPQYSYGLKP